MASRKRHREGDDDELVEADVVLYADELPPQPKKVLRDELASGESTDESVVEKGVADMEVVEEEVEELKEPVKNPFKGVASVSDLLVLRRVCKLFHELVGVSFLLVSGFQEFPCDLKSMDELARMYMSILSLRNSTEQFRSIPAYQWTFAVAETSASLEWAMSKSNAQVLHLNALNLMRGSDLQNWAAVTSLTLDCLMAFACFPPAPYERITSLTIMSPREDHIPAYLERVKQIEGLEIDLAPEDDYFSFLRYFCDTLLSNGFVSLQRIVICAASWEEASSILATFVNREKSGLLPPITHIMIFAGRHFQIPDNIDLLGQILMHFTHLEELWLDAKLSCRPEGEELNLGSLRRFHCTITGDPPVYLSVAGQSLEHLHMNIVGESIVTIDPTSTKLQQLQIAGSIQSISMLLNSLQPTNGQNPFPALHTISFTALMTEYMTMESFEMTEIPSLTCFEARFCADRLLPLALRFTGPQLRTLRLEVPPLIAVSRLLLDLHMTALEMLEIVQMPNPRASAKWNVEVPHLPSSLTSACVPAHWTLLSGPDHLAPLDMVSRRLKLSSFDFTTPFDIQLHHGLETLNLELLVPVESFLPELALLMPQMLNLKECRLKFVAPEHDPTLFAQLPIVSLHSVSLKLLNLKLLAPVWSKPSPKFTVGGAELRHPQQTSALDQNLTLGPVGHPLIASGRASCNTNGCGCSGYTHDSSFMQVGVGANGAPNMAVGVPACTTVNCGHLATDHKPAADMQTRWLSLALHCPQLTHLAVAGLSSITNFPELIHESPLLTHLQISLSHSPEFLTVAHHNLTTLHLGRLEALKGLYLKLPNLVRLYVEHCPVLHTLLPLPTPKLENVHLVSSTAITPDCRLRLQRANPKHNAILSLAAPRKYWFPDFIPEE